MYLNYTVDKLPPSPFRRDAIAETVHHLTGSSVMTVACHSIKLMLMDNVHVLLECNTIDVGYPACIDSELGEPLASKLDL